MYIEKKYFFLEEVMERWQMPERDLGYLAENDELRLSTRVHDLSLEVGRQCVAPERRRWAWDMCDSYTGLVDLLAADAFMMFRCAELRLTEFRNPNGDRLRVPDARPPVHVMLGDLLVRREERDRVEQTRGFGAAGPKPTRSAFSSSSDFRHVSCKGAHYRFGEVQAQVLRELRSAADKGDSWQSGKELLTLAGSRSMRMADVFKSQPGWRDLIESNKRGHYRLRPDLDRPE